jgi:hypothetical protein
MRRAQYMRKPEGRQDQFTEDTVDGTTHILDTTVIAKILTHLGLPAWAPIPGAAVRSTPISLIRIRSPLRPLHLPEPTIPLSGSNLKLAKFHRDWNDTLFPQPQTT